MHASGDDSYEVGAKFERDLDTDLYNRVANQAVEFLSLADGQAAVDALTDSAESQSAEPVKKPIPAPKGKSNSNAKGHCIRCATSIKLDVAKPYCASCYKSWSLYANPAYEEPHCHACGQKRTTSMEKPLCKKCWKELA
jgi:hypothetical protein